MNPDPQAERDQQIEAAQVAQAIYRAAYWEWRDHGEDPIDARVALKAAEKLADQVTELIGYASRLFREQSQDPPQAAAGWAPDTSQGLPFEVGAAIGDAVRASVTRTAMVQGEPSPPRDTVAGCRPDPESESLQQYFARRGLTRPRLR
jgi:hypothetical protein